MRMIVLLVLAVALTGCGDVPEEVTVIQVNPGEPEAPWYALQCTHTVLERSDGRRIIAPGNWGKPGDIFTKTPIRMELR